MQWVPLSEWPLTTPWITPVEEEWERSIGKLLLEGKELTFKQEEPAIPEGTDMDWLCCYCGSWVKRGWYYLCPFHYRQFRFGEEFRKFKITADTKTWPPWLKWLYQQEDNRRKRQKRGHGEYAGVDVSLDSFLEGRAGFQRRIEGTEAYPEKTPELVPGPGADDYLGDTADWGDPGEAPVQRRRPWWLWDIPRQLSRSVGELGDRLLIPRDLKVAKLWLDGNRYRDIAKQLDIGKSTVARTIWDKLLPRISHWCPILSWKGLVFKPERMMQVVSEDKGLERFFQSILKSKWIEYTHRSPYTPEVIVPIIIEPKRHPDAPERERGDGSPYIESRWMTRLIRRGRLSKTWLGEYIADQSGAEIEEDGTPRLEKS